MTNEEAIKVLNTIDNCLKGNGYDWEHEGIKTAIQALEKQIWVSTKERLPNDMEIVNITWVNRNPPPYYADIKDVPQVAIGLVMDGEWYWFSCYSENIAEFEYLADADKMDKDIEVVAWLPLPSPYKERDTE